MKERSCGGRHEVLQLLRRATSARETIVFGMVIALFALFALMSGGTFASIELIGIMSISASELGLIALGVTLLMTSGEFDLSVGSVSALAAYVLAMLYQQGLNPFLAMAIAVGSGMAAGVINGLITVRFGIPSFIVTLGAMMMWRGVVSLGTEGQWVIFRVSEPHPAFYSVLLADIGVVSAPLIWFVVVAILLVLLLNFHRFGNHVFATGGNREAARAMGINIKKTKVICFMILGGLAAFSGVMRVTRIRGFHALQGEGIALISIAAVAIGGTSIYGGVGTIVGTIFGVLIITFLEFGLIMARVPGFWYKIILGILIVAVVVINKAIEQGRKL